MTTARTSVYDILREITGWPDRYNGRGIINQSFLDAQNGLVLRTIKPFTMRLCKKAIKAGERTAD